MKNKPLKIGDIVQIEDSLFFDDIEAPKAELMSQPPLTESQWIYDRIIWILEQGFIIDSFEDLRKSLSKRYREMK